MENKLNATSSVAARINNQELVIISENAGKFVPIKPICDALGIAFEPQYQKLKEDEALSKERKLQEAMISVKKKYGKNAMLKGMNLEEGATTISRNNQIGGHKA